MSAYGDHLINAARDEAREKVAAFMLRNSFATGHGDTLDDLLSELEIQIQELRSRLRGSK